MNDYKELLHKWWFSVGEMHIAHHLAAAKYANQHKWMGLLTAILTTLTSTSIFLSARDSSNHDTFLYAGVISVLASVSAGIVFFMKFDDRIAQHFQTAITFQSLRREIEEEIIACNKDGPKKNYDHVRKFWTNILKSSCHCHKAYLKKQDDR